jgi:integrase
MVVLPGLAAVSSALPAAQRKGSKRENNGARQTEIEVRCIQRVLRWLAEARNEPEVHPVSAKDLLKSLKAAQRYHRPRYDNAEAAKLEQAASQADPRVRLEIDMQDAQRAGQLLSCMRSGLTVAADAEGLQVELQVPGRGTKPGGSFLLTDQAAAALLTALETGHLRDLEKAFLTGGPDYPLFPGGLGILTPHAVIPVGDYRPLDPSVARKLLRAVEAAAGVRHVSGRGFHGFRRRAVDLLDEEGADPGAIEAAGQWKGSQIPIDIYRARERKAARMRGAKLLSSAKARAARAAQAALQGGDGPSLETASPGFEVVVPDLAQHLKAQNLTDGESMRL